MYNVTGSCVHSRNSSQTSSRRTCNNKSGEEILGTFLSCSIFKFQELSASELNFDSDSD